MFFCSELQHLQIISKLTKWQQFLKVTGTDYVDYMEVQEDVDMEIDVNSVTINQIPSQYVVIIQMVYVIMDQIVNSGIHHINPVHIKKKRTF